MRQIFAFAIIVGGCLAGVSSAQAMTSLAPSQAAVAATLPGGPALTLVEGGCGPGGFRDRFGYCRPRRGPPPRYYGCRPGMHPTPYGCRPNF